MASVDPSTSEILEALTAAFASASESRPDGAVTMEELRALTGRGTELLRKTLGQLIADDKAECVKTPTVSITGARVRVPAYRLKG